MHWVLLSIGIAIEIVATTSLKLSDGFTKLGFAVVTLIGAVVLGQMRDGFAYLGIGLIVAGIIVLNSLSSAASGWRPKQSFTSQTSVEW